MTSALGILSGGFPATRRRVFVSYHHAVDQPYYDAFSRVFHGHYETIQDNSLDRQIDSDATEYVMRRIREDYVAGTSCTIVLCGPQTRWRKYVDWEIKATLDKQHGLIGVCLPNNPVDGVGRVHIPDRLQDNIDSGYAVWTTWGAVTASPESLRLHIENANLRAKTLIINGRPTRSRNGQG